jgi:hypothetical protein
MIKWKQKDGTESETNEALGTIKKCEALGWERVSEPEVEPDADAPDAPGEGGPEEKPKPKAKAKAAGKGNRAPEAAE